MNDRINVVIDDTDLAYLEHRYGAKLMNKALRVTNLYVSHMQRNAQVIINDSGHVDTGKLVGSIKSKVNASNRKITGEVYSGSKYARFIHEGAKHEGEEIKPHFVPFAVAPSLLTWAKRNKVIYQKQASGRLRKNPRRNGDWYFMSKKGKEYPISVQKGGLMVKQEPVKFFSLPFEQLAPEYLERMAQIVTEG